MISKAATFKQSIKKGALIMPGAFNAISAMLIEKCGFKAVYMSGAGISNSAGLPDTGILTRDEFVRQAGYIANAVNIPVIADVDTGFGGSSEVKKTVEAFEKIGVAGIQIEDQKPAAKRCGHVSGKEIISAKAMAEKIEAAYDARKNKDFLIIARTDARSVKGLDHAIKRTKIYRDAGADVIFPEALETKGEFKEFARRVNALRCFNAERSEQSIGAPLMANMTEFGKTPYITVKEFEAMGYAIVLFPMTAFRIGMKAMEDALSELKNKGTQKGLLKKMQTRQELYKLIKYEPEKCI
ncbi:MAG: isocitrate lyase/phosphoenolpyruvate mutase family protein [Deltaproteobacteria bacterium]|nr:isocitrate lyase/phosphoenolpyruvate mutase family protein [Deltaproteobacteria bacterium]